MHFISQTRYNPSIGADDQYYRIKESVRDLTGRVHSYVLLNQTVYDSIIWKTEAKSTHKCKTIITFASIISNDCKIFKVMNMNMGTWQGIYLCEYRNHGGARDLVVTIIGA